MNDYDRILSTIRECGERLTIQRRLVIEALMALSTHATINDIRRYIDDHNPDSGLAEPTVYRILQWLKGLGIVAQTDLGHSGITYELVTMPPHHHLICLNCGRIQDIDDTVMDPLRQHLRDDYAFAPRIDHMAFFGICDQCR